MSFLGESCPQASPLSKGSHHGHSCADAKIRSTFQKHVTFAGAPLVLPFSFVRP
jgi:hypothetical protein